MYRCRHTPAPRYPPPSWVSAQIPPAVSAQVRPERIWHRRAPQTCPKARWFPRNLRPLYKPGLPTLLRTNSVLFVLLQTYLINYSNRSIFQIQQTAGTYLSCIYHISRAGSADPPRWSAGVLERLFPCQLRETMDTESCFVRARNCMCPMHSTPMVSKSNQCDERLKTKKFFETHQSINQSIEGQTNNKITVLVLYFPNPNLLKIFKLLSWKKAKFPTRDLTTAVTVDDRTLTQLINITAKHSSSKSWLLFLFTKIFFPAII